MRRIPALFWHSPFILHMEDGVRVESASGPLAVRVRPPTTGHAQRAEGSHRFKPSSAVIGGRAAAAARGRRRRGRTGGAAPGPARCAAPTSSAAASACRWSRGAADSCAWSASSWSCTSGGRTRTRTACRTARACLGSVVSTSNNKRMSCGSTDTPGAR